jgi:predicted transcriptional regulator
MRGITIKLPDETLRELAHEARATGRSIAAVVREKLGARASQTARTVHDQAGDLAGSLAGGRRSARNDRPKFRRP